MGQVAIHLNLMAGIFAGTMFPTIYSDPGVFIIVPLVIINLATESRYSDNLLGSGAYLELFSQVNHDGYCLAYKFTHREFDGGVLGLAYVGTDRFGGICDKFSGTRGLNTGKSSARATQEILFTDIKIDISNLFEHTCQLSSFWRDFFGHILKVMFRENVP